MIHSVDLTVPDTNISLENINTQINTPLVLNFYETYIRYIKAIKHSLDPVSECFGYVAGAACCCLMIGVQAEENSRPASRHDVLHAAQERRQDRQELGTAFAMGYCMGDALVDSASIALGSVSCVVPAAFRSLFNPLTSTDPVCGIPATIIDETKLFDSCTCSSEMIR